MKCDSLQCGPQWSQPYYRQHPTQTPIHTHTLSLSHLQSFSLTPWPSFFLFSPQVCQNEMVIKKKAVESEKTYVNLLSVSFVTSCTAQLFSVSLSPHLSIFPLLHFSTTTVVNLRAKRKGKQRWELLDMSWVGGQAHTRATGHRADTTAWELDRMTSSTPIKTLYKKEKSVITVSNFLTNLSSFLQRNKDDSLHCQLTDINNQECSLRERVV